MDITQTSCKNVKLRFTQKNFFTFLMIILFIFFNSLKICIFNTFILYSIKRNAFIYKFIITFILDILLYFLIFKSKKRYIFAIFYLIQTFYIVFVLNYNFFTHEYFHFSSFQSLFSEGSKAASKLSITELLNIKSLIFLVDMPLFIYIMCTYENLIHLRKINKLFKKVLVITCIISIIILQLRDYKHELFFTQVISSPFSGEALMVERYGTFVNSLVDLFTQKDSAYLSNRLKYSDNTISSNGNNSSTYPNFVIIQVESMNASIVNEQYNNEYVTPFLHSLESSSIYYPYTLSYHEGGGTSDSEFSILNSVEPLADYPAIKIRDYTYPNSFVKNLASNIYDVFAFHANDGSYYNRNTAFMGMGFKAFNDISSMNLQRVIWGAPDKELFDYVSDKMKKENKPFLYYNITISSHTSFKFVDAYNYHNDLFDNMENTETKNYFNSMSYVDESINKFVSYIRNNYKNTYILIWGDHTPPLESKNTYLPSAFISDNKYFEFVPLFIVTPGNKTYTENNNVASFLDIAPTILEASGLPFTIKTDGENLLDTPISDKGIPFKGKTYNRQYLFKTIYDKEN